MEVDQVARLAVCNRCSRAQRLVRAEPWRPPAALLQRPDAEDDGPHRTGAGRLRASDPPPAWVLPTVPASAVPRLRCIRLPGARRCAVPSRPPLCRRGLQDDPGTYGRDPAAGLLGPR